MSDVRIIPARAGFTYCSSVRPDFCGDHPRSRGVYVSNRMDSQCGSGSSPLARGLRHRAFQDLGISRIIPARAGFTRCRTLRNGSWTDHPRSRGVYRVRRTVGQDRRRIIPARAGFTPASRASNARKSDHPRSRGVYTPPKPKDPSEAGSSPLARGLPIEDVQRFAIVRIIPARAGFTTRVALKFPQAPDHPRSRGVYKVVTMLARRHVGSSPLARGLPTRPDCAPQPLRIIPARAGFTFSPI